MKTNIIYREEGYLVLQKRDISFELLAEWFICHLNDYVYIENEHEFEGVIYCKDFENALRDKKPEFTIRKNFKCIDYSEMINRINIYKYFRDDVTLFRLPVFKDGHVIGEFYNSLTYQENTERYHIKNMIPELVAFREGITQYFKKRNIEKIAVISDFADDYVKDCILSIPGIHSTFFDTYYQLNRSIENGEKYDAVLDIKYPDEYRNYFIELLGIETDVYIIFDIMAEVLLQCFCQYAKRNRINVLAVYAIGKSDISYLGSDDENMMSQNKTLNDVIIDKEYLRKFYGDNQECYSYATDVCQGPFGGRVVRFNGLYNCLMDVSSNHINVKNGVRRTEGNPHKYEKAIHFFGPCIVQGICVTDQYTIESYLQSEINNYYPNKVKVVNHGSATHTPYGSFCNDILHAMDTNYNEGDIIILMDAFTETIFDILRNNGVPILDDRTLFDGTSNYFLNNTYHCNHLANKIYSDFIFHKINSAGLLSDGESEKKNKVDSYFVENNTDLSFRDDSFLHNAELLSYSKKLSEQAFPYSEGQKIGAICTQANPFTLGHKALVEYASREMDYVYVFVARDSLSDIQFLERIDIVKEALKELSNVKVFSSGAYLSSYRMFPDYFSVSNTKNEFRLTNVWAETRIFAEVYSKALGINYRILGEEPYDLYTKQLVEHLKEVLPNYGIETIVIPRVLNESNDVISASVVRKKFLTKDYSNLDKFITQYAIEVLTKYYEFLLDT